MKGFAIAVPLLLTYVCVFAQEQNANESVPPENKGQASAVLPPQRGQKDLRPKQFAAVDYASFASIDLSPKIQRLKKLRNGDREEFPLANLTPLNAVLISTQTSAVSSSYAFRVDNDEYKGAMLFIQVLKQKDGSLKYIGHVIRPGYSDVLKLRNEGGRLFFSVEEAQKVVLE